MANHHIVPVLCLEHFTDQKRQVWTYTKEEGRSWPRRPEDTAKVAHFYSFEREDGSMDETIENLLSKIESSAKVPYEKLVSGRLVSGGEKFNFAYFLAAQIVRTKTHRRHSAKTYAWLTQTHLAAQAAHKGAFRSVVKRLKAKGIDISSDEEALRQAFLDLSKFDIAVPKQIVLRSMEIMDQLAGIFDRMKWSLWRAEAGYFITSDNPVHRAVDPTTHHPLLGDHGYMNKTAIITFPLSPRMLLMMTYEFGGNGVVLPMSRLQVEGQNANRAFNAEDELYAHVDDKRIVRLAQQYRGQRPDVEGGNFAGSKPFNSVEVPRRWSKRHQSKKK